MLVPSSFYSDLCIGLFFNLSLSLFFFCSFLSKFRLIVVFSMLHVVGLHSCKLSLSIAFAVSQWFCIIMFPFSFVSRCFLISSVIYLVISWLVSSLYLLVFFAIFFCSWFKSHGSLQSERCLIWLRSPLFLVALHPCPENVPQQKATRMCGILLKFLE